jgi:hypothetical protein
VGLPKTLCGISSQGNAINDKGQVTGASITSQNSRDAFLPCSPTLGTNPYSTRKVEFQTLSRSPEAPGAAPGAYTRQVAGGA